MQKHTNFWKNIIVVWGSLFLILALAALTMLTLTGCFSPTSSHYAFGCVPACRIGVNQA